VDRLPAARDPDGRALRLAADRRGPQTGASMFYDLLTLIHVASIIVWVGGMAFAHLALRPAVATLEPPVRLRLMEDVLRRFFLLAGVAVLLAVGSGLGMVGLAAAQVAETGGRFRMPLAWNLMGTFGIIMALIFGHIRFALFGRLRRAVAASDWKAGGVAMASIRKWVGINLLIGTGVVIIAFLG
jgi:uncharacterized membrane protein